MPHKKSSNNPLITDYGQFWERTELFDVNEREDGTHYVSWNKRTWPGSGKVKPPLAGSGIYILYRGTTPVYVGKGTAKSGGIAVRLQDHAQNWYSHAWDNVSWYVFGKTKDKTIDVVEALLIASIPGLLNGAQPGAQFGKRCRPGDETSDALNTLWKKTAENRLTT